MRSADQIRARAEAICLRSLALNEQVMHRLRAAQLRTNVHRSLSITSIADSSVELRRAIEARLRNMSPGFMRLLNVDQSTGTFEERVNGKTVTSKFSYTIDGPTVVLKTLRDAEPELFLGEHIAELLRDAKLRDAPPNPYEHDLKLRAAGTTPSFEDTYRSERLAQLDAEHARCEAHLAAQPTPRLTTAEAAEFAPPNSYEAGIKTLRSTESQAEQLAKQDYRQVHDARVRSL